MPGQVGQAVKKTGRLYARVQTPRFRGNDSEQNRPVHYRLSQTQMKGKSGMS